MCHVSLDEVTSSNRANCLLDSWSTPALVSLGSQVSDNDKKGGKLSHERESVVI